jgi:hypothetical protein
MFFLSGFYAADTSVFGRLAPVILWACLGVLLISGTIGVRSLQLMIVGASCCVGIVLPFMRDAFAACTEFKCGLFQELLTGPFSSGNYLAQLASLALLVGAFCFRGPLRLSVIALNVLLLVATDSRTSQVAVALGLFAGWLVKTILVNTRRSIPKGTVTFVAWSAALGAAAVGCYAIFNLAGGDFSNRANIWARGVRVLGGNWLTGLGGDAWSAFQETGALPALFPHSQYLMMLFWGGVAGVVGYIVILAAAISRVAGTAMLPFAVSVVFFMLALGMTEAYWNPAAVDGHSFFILLALAIAYRGADVPVAAPDTDTDKPAAARPRRGRFETMYPDQEPAELAVPVRTPTTIATPTVVDIPKVSVIVPAYNVRKYLDNLRQQLTTLTMLDDLEVIIVDDGSTDGSARGLRELADSLRHGIYLTTGTNRGAAAARNLGVARATAEFVWFVDCDDTWDPAILETMYTEIQAAGADLAVCQAELVAESGDLLRYLDRVPKTATVGGRELLHRVLTGRINGYLWNKLFRRGLFTAETFPLLSSQSDLAGLIGMLPAIGRATLIEQTMYFHVVRSGSITTSKNPNLENLRRCADAMDAALATMNVPRDCRAARYFYTKIIRYSICNTGYRLSGGDPATTAVQERARLEIDLRDVVEVCRENLHDGAAVAVLRYARPVYRVLLTRRWQRLGRSYFAAA